MKLFFSPGACSLAPHIALQESGLKYQAEKVEMSTKSWSGGDYKQINPKGSVPCLQLDNGEVLMQYIADQKPEAGLIPKAGSWERYRCQEWLNYIATEVHKGFAPLWAPTTPAEYKTTVIENLKKKFDFLSNHFKANQFLMGSHFTVADGYLLTVLNWTKPLKIDMSAYPNLLSFMERVQTRPAVAATLKAEGLV